MQLLPTISVPPGSAGGVRSRTGANSPGQIGSIGPLPPGLSRFWAYIQAPVNQPDTAPTVLPNSSSGGIYQFRTGIYAGGGVTPLIGAAAQGQIGAPGPMRPGLSRLWKYQIEPINQPTSSNITLVTEIGSFIFTGQAATFPMTFVTAPGSFIETGQAATFPMGFVTAPGSFVETGQAATFGSSIITAAGSFVETGEPSTLPLVMFDAAGAFVFTGQDAGLLPSGNQVLTTAPGSFVVTGKPATFTVGFTTLAGAFVETGQPSTLPLVMFDAPGAFVFTGEDAGLLPSGNQVLTTAPGSFVFTGKDAGLSPSGNQVFTTAPGSFVVTGKSATLTPSGVTFQLFEQALVARLLAIPEITDIVGTDIFVGAIPQTYDLGALGPALTYFVPTKPRGHDLAGSDGTATAQVQIDAWATPSPLYPDAVSDVKAITEAVFNGLNGKPVETSWGDGTCLIMSAVQQNEMDADEPPMGGGDKPVYRTMVEYGIKYRVRIPTLT